MYLKRKICHIGPTDTVPIGEEVATEQAGS